MEPEKKKGWWDKPISEVLDNIYVKRKLIKISVYTLGVLALSVLTYYVYTILTNNKTTNITTIPLTPTMNVTDTQVMGLGFVNTIPIFAIVIGFVFTVIGMFVGHRMFWMMFFGLQLFMLITLGLSFWTIFIPLGFLGMHFIFKYNHMRYY